MARERKSLDRQVIVVTGASSGIGLATALAATDHGARLVLVARSANTLDDIAQSIRETGGEVLVAAADVADRDAMFRVAEEAVARFGGIDTWVNNAGVSIYGRLEQLSDADGRRLFDTNLWGTVNGSLAALPHLKASGGVLINVGSEVSDAAVPLQGIYSASKHAVKGFTDALRVELADEGVKVGVTLVQPTAVDTPYPEHARNLMQSAPMLPSPRIEPEKVAEAILDAATGDEAAVKVGAMAKVNTWTARIAPRLAELMGRMQVSRQQRDEAPQDTQGALHRASELSAAGAGRVHGRGDENAPSRQARKEIAEQEREVVREADHAMAARDRTDRPAG